MQFSADEWAAFLALVAHHGMAPHVHGVIGRLAAPPEEVASALALLHDDSSRYSLLLTARLLKVLDSFVAADIPVIALKGPALSQQLYDDPGVRASVDLDLLVPPGALDAAARVLKEQGYGLESSLAHLGTASLMRHCSELTFRGADGTGIDLHWSSAPADYPCRIPDDVLWSSLAFVTIAGRRVPVLTPECLLVYLCIHGTRHCWTKLRWLSDVGMLVSQRPTPNGQLPTLDWERVSQIAGKSRATHAVNLGLRLAQSLLNAELPETVAARVDADRVIDRAAAEATSILTSATPQEPPSSVRKTMFGASVAPSRWLAARHVAALMKAPTEAEALRLKLPRPLFFLYYPYRFARLAAKYS